jgi:N-methylhydantoinase A/oxoprolinase/acetone carboxylase beta subunit
MPLNERQIREECQILKSKGIKDVAVIGIFSPLDIKGLQEENVRKIVQQEMPDADIVLSRDSKCSIPPSLFRLL